MSTALIEVEGLEKTYRQGFWMRRVPAVRGISFQVHEGDIFGFLGPNGAGKTTSIKVLTGLIAASAGKARLFGKPVTDASARQKLGFLPENPYVYPYLTPKEFVSMSARLAGLSAGAARSRTLAMLDRVGLLYAADRPARRLSKGMLQRTGLAAALVGDPELLILDEPMSGLDPVGRKEVRDLILSEQAAGRTIFFSTHILSDVEAMCDRVTILRQGRVVVSGYLKDLLNRAVKLTDVVIRDASASFVAVCKERGWPSEQRDHRTLISVEGEEALQSLLKLAVERAEIVVEVIPHQESLETLFVRKAIDEAASDPPPKPEQAA